MGWFGSSSKPEIEKHLAENAKLIQMLDNVDNIVMLCDTSHDNKIFYMNRRAKELMAQHRAELNAGLRGADVAAGAGSHLQHHCQQPGGNHSGRLKQRRDKWEVTLRLVNALGLARLFQQAPPASAAEKALFDDYCDKKDDEKKKDYSEKLEHAVRTPSLLFSYYVVVDEIFTLR
jgi:hypothetical protein